MRASTERGPQNVETGVRSCGSSFSPSLAGALQLFRLGVRSSISRKFLSVSAQNVNPEADRSRTEYYCGVWRKIWALSQQMEGALANCKQFGGTAGVEQDWMVNHCVHQ
jgi:hypothetical protein